MALPDVPDTYRIDVKQQMLGEELHNIFFYRDMAVVGPTPAQVAQAFWDKVKGPWRGIPTTTMNFTFLEVNVEQLFSPYGFFTLAIPVGESIGTRVNAADVLAPFIAMYIELVVGTRATRPGGKRIAGWTEADVLQQFFGGAAVVLGAALGAVFDDTFVTSVSSATMTPVIVGYPTPPPASQPLRVQDVVGHLVDVGISHQVSRDPRRS